MATVRSIEGPGPWRRLEIRSPIDDRVLGEIDCSGPEEVEAALERARKEQPAWAALSFAERARFVRRGLHALIDRQDDVLKRLVFETGKVASEALASEIVTACDALGYYAKNAERFLRASRKPLHGPWGWRKRLTVVYPPRGVVAVIAPASAPLLHSVGPVVQA